MIYHYTSIETLALILESQKIRFTKLNSVDDIFEEKLLENKNIGNHLYISCWTKNAAENVALWKMYTHGKGIRIGLPNYPFIKKKINLSEWVANDMNFNSSDLSIPIPFSFSEAFNQKYFIVPPFCLPGNAGFSTEVIYLKEADLIQKYKGLYNFSGDETAYEMNIKMLELGKYKHERWKFQEESRFILMVIPTGDDFVFPDKMLFEKLNSSLVKYLEKGQSHAIDDFYVSLAPDALKEMQITIGPLCSHGDKLIIEALRIKYGLVKPAIDSKVGVRK